MVRNSVKYVPFKDRKAVTGALEKIYLAPSEELAESALEDFSSAWDSKYPMISKSWRARWNEIIPFLKFPPDIRKAMRGKRSFP
jgi:transposase-like protein